MTLPRRSLVLAALAAPFAGCALAPPRGQAFARSLGDDVFRLDRRETELNSAIPRRCRP